MSLKQKFLIAIMGASLSLCGAASASAGTWQVHHPRRVDVNHRLANQNLRIAHNLKQGKISVQQAAYLHHEDHMVRMNERRDASLHNSHITLAQQARLNHRENGISSQIYRDAH